jgi:quercetin dioxygenase-like cupin family protein
MPAVRFDDAPTFDTGGATITGLAAPSRGSCETSAWRVALRADRPSPRHSLDREELFIVLTGAVTAQYADHDETVSAGGALIVPAGTEFSIVARGKDAEAVCVLPAGGRATVDGQEFEPPWAQ